MIINDHYTSHLPFLIFELLSFLRKQNITVYRSILHSLLFRVFLFIGWLPPKIGQPNLYCYINSIQTERKMYSYLSQGNLYRLDEIRTRLDVGTFRPTPKKKKQTNKNKSINNVTLPNHSNLVIKPPFTLSQLVTMIWVVLEEWYVSFFLK